jgi:hypothetical protein
LVKQSRPHWSIGAKRWSRGIASTPSLAPTFGCEARLGLASAMLSAKIAPRTARRSATYVVWGSLTFGGVNFCR